MCRVPPGMSARRGKGLRRTQRLACQRRKGLSEPGEKCVNAGTLVSPPEDGDRSSVCETLAQNLCTGQSQADRGPRPAALTKGPGSGTRRARPFPPARLPPVPRPLAADSALPGRGRQARGAGRPSLTCDSELRGSGLSCAAPGWAALGCAPGLRAARQRPRARLRPARLRPAVPRALAGGPRGAGWARGGRRRRARLRAAPRPLGSSLFGQ